MADKPKRKDSKLYVRVSSVLEEQLNQLADYMGTTKSALITYYIAQGVKQETAKKRVTERLTDPQELAKVINQLSLKPEQLKELLASQKD